MRKVLEQKKYFKTKTFTILKDGLEFQEKYFLNEDNHHIPFEHIHGEPEPFFHTSKIKFWLTIFFGCLLVLALYEQIKNNFSNTSALIFYGIAALVGLAAYWASREEWFVFRSQNMNFTMYRKRPSGEEVEEFLNNFSKTRNEYLEKCFTVTPSNVSTVDELYKLYWLKKEKMITVKEFEKLKTEIIKKKAIDKGFISNN